MKIKSILVICFAAMIVTACSNSEIRNDAWTNSNVETANNTNGDNNINAEELTDNVYLAVSIPSVESCYSYKAELGIVQDCNIVALFSETPDEDIEEQASYIQYSNNEGERGALSEESGFGYYCTEIGNKLDSWSVRLGNDEQFFSDYLKEDSNFFADPIEAKDNIKAELSRVGITEYDLKLYQVSKEMFDFYCDYYNDNLLMDSQDQRAEELFGTYKEFYYAKGRFLLNGIPVFDDEAGSVDNGSGIFGSSFSVIYTEAGIEALWITNHYIADFETKNENELLSEEEIKEILIKVFENEMIQDKVILDKAELVYMPIPQNEINSLYNEFLLSPVWSFTSVNGESWYIDAFTGKEIA